MPVNRRTVLGLLGGAAGATAVPGLHIHAAIRPDVVVIGSGIAGMSLAYDLQTAGCRVIVLEKNAIAGGRMIETWIGPRYINPHAGGVFGANREMFDLAARVNVSLAGSGLYDESMIDNGCGIYKHALRFHLPEIMNIPGLSPETKQRLPVLLSDLEKFRHEVDPCLVSSGAAYDEESMWEYYVRKLGKKSAKELVDYWIDPVFDAWGARPGETSCVPLLAWFAQQEAELVKPDAGIGVLTRKLVTLLDVRLNTTVRYISPADVNGRHTVRYLTADGMQRSVTPDIVVCAVEGKYVLPLAQQLTDVQKSLFNEIYSTKYASVTYILKEKAAPKVFNMGRYIPNHPDPQKRKLYMWFATPSDPTVRACPPTLEVWPARREIPRWVASGRTLPDYCLSLIKPFYKEINDTMIEDVVVMGGDDLIYMPTGYVKKMDMFLREQKKARRGLYFAGDYLGAMHTGGACASGRSTARTIMKHWI